MAKRFATRAEVLEYLETLPFKSVLEQAADAIFQLQSRTEKIVITQEQFEAVFKIRGLKDNGEIETRGRKKNEQIEIPE